MWYSNIKFRLVPLALGKWCTTDFNQCLFCSKKDFIKWNEGNYFAGFYRGSFLRSKFPERKLAKTLHTNDLHKAAQYINASIWASGTQTELNLENKPQSSEIDALDALFFQQTDRHIETFIAQDYNFSTKSRKPLSKCFIAYGIFTPSQLNISSAAFFSGLRSKIMRYSIWLASLYILICISSGCLSTTETLYDANINVDFIYTWNFEKNWCKRSILYIANNSNTHK